MILGRLGHLSRSKRSLKAQDLAAELFGASPLCPDGYSKAQRPVGDRLSPRSVPGKKTYLQGPSRLYRTPKLHLTAV